jgi:all-trans-retinol dehydrogenase (NAD+)
MRHVLITGAGRGLVRALASAFAGAGAAVAVGDLDPVRVETVAAELRQRGAHVLAQPLDVTNEESIQASRRRIAAEFGPIDVLVNNAGIVHGGTFLEVPLDRHRATIAVNFTGLVGVTHAFLPDLLQRSAPAIVNIASASALAPLPGGGTYAASKAAVLSFTDSLREELRQARNGHVHVMAVCPCFIDTGMFAGVTPPRGTRMLSADALAERIVQSLDRRQELLIAPGSVRVCPARSTTGCAEGSAYRRRWSAGADDPNRKRRVAGFASSLMMAASSGVSLCTDSHSAWRSRRARWLLPTIPSHRSRWP